MGEDHRRFGAMIAALIIIGEPAHAKKQTFWNETVAIIAVGQGVCGVPLNDKGMPMAIGSAMIELAISKDEVVARARKRAHFIVTDLQKRRTQNTFCQAFGYYLKNGYPR